MLQRLGTTRIKAAALEELIQDGIEQAVKQEAIPAIGQPQLRSSFEDLINNYEPGKPLTILAAVDVEPEVNLVQYTDLLFQAEEVKYDQQYTDLLFQAEEVKYDPEQVENTLDKERQELGTLIPVEGRAAQIGDIAVVDFKGSFAKAEGEDETAELEPIPGAEATDFQVELQEDKFIPGFISGIVGMNPEETREIAAQFPDPYANEDLAGKAATFTVTLKELKEKELPEINDDFAQEISDFETLEELRASLVERYQKEEELRASLVERYQKEADDKTKANKQEALITELLKHVEVDLPATLIEQEVDAMLTQTAIRLSQQGLDVRKLFTQDIIPQLRERSRTEAIERIKRSLSLREIGKRESIEVTTEEIAARVTELLEQYPDEQDVDEDKLRSIVENELLTEKIIDWLLEHSSVELVPEGSLLPTEETEAAESDADVPQTEEENSEPSTEVTEG